MMTAWMLYSAVVGVLIAGAALLLHALRKGSGAPLRWIWTGAILLTVAFTVSAPWRGQTETASLDLTGVTEVRTVAGQGPAITWWDRAQRIRTEGIETLMLPLHAGVSLAARAPRIVNYSALLLWNASCALSLLFLAAMYRRAVRMRHTWARSALLGVPVRVSPDAGPAVIGLAPPEIVVPQWLLERTAQEQQLVLEHEASHVQARDPWLLLAACIAVALMPWNPAMWFMLARLRLAVELDCDGRMLRAGASKRSYGQLLIELSQHRSRLSPAMPAFSHSTSHLERRLLAMTARPSRSPLPARVASALLVGAALLVACESKLPTSAEIADMDVARATKRAAETGIDTSKMIYFLDGKRVSKAEMEQHGGTGQIASVGWKKAAGGDSVAFQVKSVLHADTLHFKRASAEAIALGIDGKPMEGMRRRVGGPEIALSAAETAKVRERTPFNGLLIVDGVETESSKMNTISPDRIESVEVVKGLTATTLYTNPLAVNGVIKITLKKAK